MQFHVLDFFIGFLLMNAMPHLLFFLIEARFLSLFGYSPAGNGAYALLNVVIAAVLFHLRYGIGELLQHGVVVGSAVIILAYVVTGRFLYRRWRVV